MQFSTYQIIAPLVSFVAITYAWNLVMRQKKSIWEAFLWTLFWGMIILITLEPRTLDYLTRWTGMKDREDALLVTSIGVLFFIVFYFVVRLEETEQRQTKLIRKIALKQANLEKENT